MLFHEVYGSYFNVVAAVLSEATALQLTDQRLTQIVQEKAFAESSLSIPAAIKSEEWPLVNQNMRTPIKAVPTMPLTTLQKRWLKALLQDPRIALFDPCVKGLEDVEPLYKPGTFVYFDQYSDGDPYTDPDYIACFKLILRAIREHRKLRIRFKGHTGIRHSMECIPYRMEYSEKDDKFRVLVSRKHQASIINMVRVRSCELLDEFDLNGYHEPKPKLREMVLDLYDERNALERVLLHFSHFEKETVRLSNKHYQIKLRYEREDETELLIRVLSFGPVLKVSAPAVMVEAVKERLGRQTTLNASRGVS